MPTEESWTQRVRRALYMSRRGPCSTGRKPVIHIYGGPAKDVMSISMMTGGEIPQMVRMLVNGTSKCKANTAGSAWHVAPAVAAYISGALQLEKNVWSEDIRD